MPTLTKFNAFAENLAEKVHNLGSDTLKVMLSNTAPSTSNAVKADITEISAGNGYTAGGGTVTITSSTQTGGVYKLVLQDFVFTASGGTIGPFRYIILYNDTPTSPADPLIGFYDFGSAITMQNGETFTVDFDGTNGAITFS